MASNPQHLAGAANLSLKPTTKSARGLHAASCTPLPRLQARRSPPCLHISTRRLGRPGTNPGSSPSHALGISRQVIGRWRNRPHPSLFRHIYHTAARA